LSIPLQLIEAHLISFFQPIAMAMNFKTCPELVEGTASICASISYKSF